jgi:aminodeoxychorismate synthase component I
MSDFVSVNSWTRPGVLYQAHDAVEIVEGGAEDWPHFEERFRHYAREGSDGEHPEGAAVGYIGYDGDFWFGIYPKIEVRGSELENPLWRHRRSCFQPAGADMSSDFKAEQNRAEFEDGVRRAREYIAAGDIYQVNLAQRFSTPFSGNPYALFEQLCWRSPAPGAAFLDTGRECVLSASPELFLKITGPHIETRPIKGTRPRSTDRVLDRQLAFELMTSPKELAELIMITDLERNDLGRLCEYGSVTVTELARLESYAQVHHLVSTVEGTMRPGLDARKSVRACFPGGSITGAPKKRAMEIIAELEPVPRGIYTGAVGYFGFNGDAAFNIAIRTMVLRGGELSFFTGSGITADSDPSAEYDETLHKAAGMRQALAAYYSLPNAIIH